MSVIIIAVAAVKRVKRKIISYIFLPIVFLTQSKHRYREEMEVAERTMKMKKNISNRQELTFKVSVSVIVSQSVIIIIT